MHDRKCNYLRGVGKKNHPMNCVSYDDAERFCTARKKRMPTAAEWELAARGLDQRAFPWGDQEPDDSRVCWQSVSKRRDQTTCPVGSFPAGKSPYGILDLAGNLAEWTSTAGEDYTRASNVVSGGSFLVDPMDDPPSRMLRSDTVFSFARSDAAIDIGFRCARDLETNE
jgi:formylglycine-generating enzyme required for sulfatase activity